MKGLLFVTTPGTKISRDGNVLAVETPENKKRIPVGAISHVFLMGMVNITTPAIRFLSSRGKFVFLMNRFGKLVSLVYPEFYGSDNNVRIKQYQKFTDEKFKVKETKKLLKEKLNIACTVLYDLYEGNKQGFEDIENFRESTLESIRYAKKSESLLGIDGSIMSTLFRKFSSFNETEFTFTKREYYPPPDPVNALLSFSFSIFYSLLHPIVISQGFDPYLGFFHIKRGRHAVLCSDILEIVRPRLIHFVFNSLNDGFFTKEDFSKDRNGCYLKPKALKAFAKLYADVVIHGKNNLYMAEIVNFIQNLKRDILS